MSEQNGGKQDELLVERIIKDSFAVIGKEGSTEMGSGFVQKLWADANAHYGEAAACARTDETGIPAGFWGLMSDFSRSFLPWEDHFSKGYYLAGVECMNDAEAPQGWVKWVVPAFEYLRVECVDDSVFGKMIAFLEKNDLSLAGAVQDYTCPRTGKSYMLFPIRKL